MTKSRVRAFTFMEVTVAMLLTGIVIGITYTVYSIVLKSYNNFGKRNDRVSVVAHLDHALKWDFDRADTILKDSDGLALVMNKQTIKYAFFADYILRKTTRNDTFKVKSQDWLTEFEGVPLYEPQTETEKNRVDELYFKLIFDADTIPCRYTKSYSSENLIQRNANAVN